MADNKSQAINEAKDATISSVGFMLSATKAQSDEIKKSSLVAAKNVVEVRKNIVKLVEKFKVYENAVNQIKQVLSKGGDTSIQVTKIGIIVSSGGNAYKQKEAEQETKPKALELVQGAAESVASIVPTAAILALAIPFLLTPEVKEMIGSFFDGFLEGLGLGKKAIDNIKLGLGITAGIIAGYFSYKVLSGVYDAFMQMKKLAEVMGLLGEATALEKDKIDTEKKQVAAAGDKAKDELKDAKKDIKKGKKLGKMSVIEKAKLLFTKIGPKLKSLAGNFLKAIPIIGSVIGIGFILYDLFDIGKDIVDMFTGSPDDKDEEAEQEAAPMPAATSEPQAAAVAVAEPESKPTAGSTMSAEMGPDVTMPTPTTPSSEPAPSPSTDGALIRETSVEIEQADVDLNQTAGGVNITTIDNSTTIVDASKENILSSTPVYSISVGM